MPDPSPSTTAPAAPKTTVEALDELFKPVNRSDAPGLVVGIAQHGKIIYRRGFGLASVELAVAQRRESDQLRAHGARQGWHTHGRLL